MNEIIESLYKRKSMRVYEERTIPEEMKRIILEAAAQAPSAGCQQLYTILDLSLIHILLAVRRYAMHLAFWSSRGY